MPHGVTWVRPSDDDKRTKGIRFTIEHPFVCFFLLPVFHYSHPPPLAGGQAGDVAPQGKLLCHRHARRLVASSTRACTSKADHAGLKRLVF